jgi:hypothetical protein
MIRVLVAEDMRILRDTLVSVLNLEDDIKVVAQVAAGTDIVPAALAERPDLAVLDIDLPGLDGIADPATWRDLVWITVDTLVGWLLTLASAGLIAWGLFGVVMPTVWHPIVTAHGSNWYAFIHVTTASSAWLSAALGVAFIALGLLTAPWLLRRYGAFAQTLLSPTRTA